MRFVAVATDYDGTLATHGSVDESTLEALFRLRRSGRKVLLVTGRQLPDLQSVFPGLAVFDRVVAENGALLYDPRTAAETLLCEPPPPPLLRALRESALPVSAGRAMIATREPHDLAVMGAIRDLGLDFQIIFNKGSVMVLPTGVNKATGLRHALQELSIAPEAVAGIGDAENDHEFLAACGCAVAVANALPAVRERADLVTVGAHGAGVIEVIEELLANDLRACVRHR